MNLPARLLGVGAIVCASTATFAQERDVDQVAVIRQLATRPEIRQALELARTLERGGASDRAAAEFRRVLDWAPEDPDSRRALEDLNRTN